MITNETLIKVENLQKKFGDIEVLKGIDITDPKVNINLHRQKMGMVFQHFNLFPHMTILKNMTIAPMKLLKLSKEDLNFNLIVCASVTSKTPFWEVFERVIGKIFFKKFSLIIASD